MKHFFKWCSRSLIIIIVLLAVQWGEAFAKEKLVLGIHPYLPAAELMERFEPLANYLAGKTGADVEIKISPSYEEHIRRVGRNEVDIAFMGPVSYVEMTSEYGEKHLLAKLEVEGFSTFVGVIFVAKNSPVKKLQDLKGKRFAFADKESTMGHIVPRYVLLQGGVDAKDFAEYFFMTNHENVALGVLTGDYDAGAVKSEVFDEYYGRGLRAVARTPLIPEHVFVASTRLDKRVLKKLGSLLRGLKKDPDGQPILSVIRPGVTGLVKAEDRDYDGLREILEKVKRAGGLD